MFSLGESSAIARAVPVALGWAVARIWPQEWKKAYSLLKQPKEAARLLAIERFPEKAKLFARKKDHGRGDASILALYGWGTRH